MTRRIPKGGLVLSVALSAVAALLYVVLNNSFGGPQFRMSARYEVTALFDDSQGLLPKSPVLLRGVKVGEVADVRVRGEEAAVTLTLEKRYTPIHRNATLQVGQRSLLGEPFLELDRGDEAAVAIPSGGIIARSRTFENVELDEALAVLDPAGRRQFNSMIQTFGRATRSPRASDELNASVAELRHFVSGLRRLTDALHGQEPDIAAFVEDGRDVIRELGLREGSLRKIVSGGRATLDAMASHQAALERALAELPRLLGSARTALLHTRPLLIEARPLLAELRGAAPDLGPSLRRLRPVSADTRALIDALPALNRTARPVLRQAVPLLRRARPVGRRLEPALANLVPVVRYLEPYRNHLSAYFANAAGNLVKYDARGPYARTAFFPVTAMSQGQRNEQFFSLNPLPGPTDALDPQAYSGEYPRLMPFRP